MTSYVTWLKMCTVKYDWEKTGIKDLLYKRPAISDYVGFQFFDTAKYYRDGENLGKFLGPYKNVGVFLCCTTLNINYNTTDCLTISTLTQEEREVELKKAEMASFEKALEECLGVFQYDTYNPISMGGGKVGLYPNYEIPEYN